LLSLALLAPLVAAHPQQAPETEPVPSQEGAEAAPEAELIDAELEELESPEAAAARRMFESIQWLQGPAEGKLGTRATVLTPDGLQFANASDTRKLLELMQNQPSNRELGLVATANLDWFVVFEFDESGYVSDEEKDELDADALMESLREGQEYGNEERKRRGWDTLELVGWSRPPYYDENTRNLEWATRLRSSAGGESVNHNSRALGRHGVMELTLVCGPDEYEAILPQFHELIKGFKYVEGERYSEFTSGDKVAKYGLTALIAGGAGAVAAKTGLLGKFWKFIVGGVVALGALLKKVFGGGSNKETARARSASPSRRPRRRTRAASSRPAPRAERRGGRARWTRSRSSSRSWRCCTPSSACVGRRARRSCCARCPCATSAARVSRRCSAVRARA
jgi:uncharacterized membrane-anchored protein